MKRIKREVPKLDSEEAAADNQEKIHQKEEDIWI